LSTVCQQREVTSFGAVKWTLQARFPLNKLKFLQEPIGFFFWYKSCLEDSSNECYWVLFHKTSFTFPTICWMYYYRLQINWVFLTKKISAVVSCSFVMFLLNSCLATLGNTHIDIRLELSIQLRYKRNNLYNQRHSGRAHLTITIESEQLFSLSLDSS
jgi:hypothetical protein